MKKEKWKVMNTIFKDVRKKGFGRKKGWKGNIDKEERKMKTSLLLADKNMKGKQ